MKVSKLRRARALIASGERWAPGAWAPIDTLCAIQALQAVDGSDWIRDLLWAAQELYGTDSIVHVNDRIGLDAVLACYDYAIDRAEAEGR